jgi:hypothetical protein
MAVSDSLDLIVLFVYNTTDKGLEHQVTDMTSDSPLANDRVFARRRAEISDGESPRELQIGYFLNLCLPSCVA